MCATPANLPEGHTLKYFTAGDIVPRSVWDQNFRPVAWPAGMVLQGSQISMISAEYRYGQTSIWLVGTAQFQHTIRLTL